MGPMSSPRKWSNDEGVENKGSRRKRKKFKHKLLEEGWGELPLPEHQGANQRTPKETELEQELQQGEPVSREQDKGMEMEQEQRCKEKEGSRIPGEQSLVQLRMTGFLNPAPPTQGWPTLDNPAARGEEEGPTATRSSSSRSPKRGSSGSISRGRK